MKLRSFFWNFVGVAVIIGSVWLSVEVTLRTPVMESSAKTGSCLRVVAYDGSHIKNGCSLARNGQIATDHRYVAR